MSPVFPAVEAATLIMSLSGILPPGVHALLRVVSEETRACVWYLVLGYRYVIDASSGDGDDSALPYMLHPGIGGATFPFIMETLLNKFGYRAGLISLVRPLVTLPIRIF